MNYMYVKEAAKIAHVSPKTIRKWCREKKIKNAIRLSIDNRWCIPLGTVFPNGKYKPYQKPEPMDRLSILQYFFGG